MKQTTTLLIFLALIISGCKKKNNTPATIPVNAGLKADFGYKPGSYWIYKDALSGNIDSAYVTSNTIIYRQLGCALMEGAPEYEIMTISIKVSDNNPAVSEHWAITLTDSIFSLSLSNNKDVVESGLILQPFTYPFRLGNSTLSEGCLMYPDSACVTDIIPIVSINNQNFSNTVQLNHAGRTNIAAYNDCFYTSPEAGSVKIVFDHPTVAVHRVLELQRYKIVR